MGDEPPDAVVRSMRQIHIPPFLNYECQACGRCCHDYEVVLSEEEYDRLSHFEWSAISPQLAGRSLFEPSRGRSAAGPYRFHFGAETGCDFLGADGRCLIHQHLGLRKKAISCRLFPFTFAETPTGTYVGLRFNCVAAARGTGGPIIRQRDDIARLHRDVRCAARQEAFGERVSFAPGKSVAWDDYLHVEDAITEQMLRFDIPLDLRLVAIWRSLATLRETDLEKFTGQRLVELVRLLTNGAAQDASEGDPPPRPPGPFARAMFRQLLHLFHSRTSSAFRTGSLLQRLGTRLGGGWTAVGFLLGRGRVRLHGREGMVAIGEVRHVSMPRPSPGLTRMLENYLAGKVFGKQIFGPMFFGYDFVTGCAVLLCAYAAILWFARAMALTEGRDTATVEDIAAAIEYVDFTYGYSDFPRFPGERLRARLLARGDTPARLASSWGRLPRE